MLHVSQAFLDTIASGVVDCRVKIDVSVNRDSAVLCTLEDEDIVFGTLNTQNQCNSGSNFSIGGVFAGQCKFTVTESGMKKLSDVACLRTNRCFVITEWIRVNKSDTDITQNSDGRITIGVWYSTGVERNDCTAKFTCSDGMLQFDKDISSTAMNVMTTELKSPLDWLWYICRKCSNSTYHLSVSNDFSASDIANGAVEFRLPIDNSIKTYRDFLGWVAILTGTFATIDRFGNLKLIDYSNSSVYTISHRISKDVKVGDTPTKITGMLSTVAGYDYAVGNDDSTSTYNGIQVSVGEIPFLREIHPANTTVIDPAVEGMLDEIYSAFKKITFFGADLSCIQLPFLELGDKITIERVITHSDTTYSIQKEYDVLITNYSWTYGNFEKLRSDKYNSSSSARKGKLSSKPKTEDNKDDPLKDIVTDLGTFNPDENGQVMMDGYVGTMSMKQIETIRPNLASNLILVSDRTYTVNLPNTFTGWSMSVIFEETATCADLNDLIGTSTSWNGVAYRLKRLKVDTKCVRLTPYVEVKNEYGSQNGNWSMNITQGEIPPDDNVFREQGDGVNTEGKLSLFYGTPDMLTVKENGDGYSGYRKGGKAVVKVGVLLQDTVGDGSTSPNIEALFEGTDSDGDKVTSLYQSSSPNGRIPLPDSLYKAILGKIVFVITKLNFVFTTNVPDTSNETSSQKVSNEINSKASQKEVNELKETVATCQTKIIAFEARLTKDEALIAKNNTDLSERIDSLESTSVKDSDLSSITSKLNSLQSKVDSMGTGGGTGLLPPTLNSFTADCGAETSANKDFNLVANALANSGGSLSYRYSYNTTGSTSAWDTITSDFRVTNSYSVTRNNSVITTYYFKVDVLESVNMGGTMVSGITQVKVYPAISFSSPTVSPASPRVHGTAITLATGAVTGGKGDYKYKFSVTLSGTETIIQDYSTTATAVWTPTVAGSYTINFYVTDSLGYIKKVTKSYTVS